MNGVEIFHPRYFLIPKISMGFQGFSLFLSSLKLIREVYRTFPFDLIDGHYIYPDGFAATLLAKMMKKPVVLSARGSDINQFVGFRSIKPMIRYSMESASHLISVCEALKKEMACMGIKDEKISVIPNGVDTGQFKPIDRREAREILSLPNHGRIILSVGSLIPRKGFDILLTAFHRLLQDDRDLHLYIIGEGPSRTNLQRQIKELQLSAQVTLLGEIPNEKLMTWYNAADVSCLASSREGWANVIMESLACGTPVVATKTWGTPEILNSTDLGILVDYTSQSFSEGMNRGLGINWDRRRIRAHVEHRSWFKVANEVKGVFDRVLNESVV